MEYTLADAAKAAKVNKSTMFRAIKSGKVSARRLEDGSYRIDAAELARVYDLQHLTRNDTDATNQGATADEGTATPEKTGLVGVELAVLRLKVQMLEDQLTRERELRDQERETVQETVTDLRKRLDRAEERVLALTVESTAPATSASSEVAASVPLSQPKPQSGFLARLFGRS